MLMVQNTASPWPRMCDTCRAAASAVYCRADLAYLCSTCDAEIHSANPLARRHHRVPIGDHGGGGMLPMIGRLGGDDDCGGFLAIDDDYNICKKEEELETASWLVDKGVFGEEVDEYLDLEEYTYTSCENENWEMNYGYAKQAQRPNYSYGGDFVVPIQTHRDTGKEAGTDQLESPPPAASMWSQSQSHVSPISSMEVGVQVSGMDREARVLRYKEKKKNRKFEKTIRYASRKAYAETRPRIKGRFAKRKDAVHQFNVDPMFSPFMNASAAASADYGIVPSFS